MKVKLDQNKCIGCGLCPTIAPDIFTMDYEIGKAKVKKQPQTKSKQLESAVQNCPVSAISLEDEK